MWLYILGVFLGFYVTTKIFRHIVNKIIVGTLKVILWLLGKLFIRTKAVDNTGVINQVSNDIVKPESSQIVGDTISSVEFAKMLKDNPKLLVNVKR